MAIPPIYTDAELQEHWRTKYVRSETARHVWADPLRQYVQENSTPRPYDLKTWKQLQDSQRELSLRLLQKAALLPDATSRLAGRAFVLLVLQLRDALGNTTASCYEILRDVLDEYNMRPPLGTYGSFRVAKTRYFPK